VRDSRGSAGVLGSGEDLVLRREAVGMAGRTWAVGTALLPQSRC
jgi:hypothetical protein